MTMMDKDKNRITTDSSANSKNTEPFATEGKNLLQITKDIMRSDFKEHNMLLYPDLQSYREIYSECTRQALENNEAVFLATTYESFENISNTLSSKGIHVDNETSKGNLVIVDAVGAYQIDTSGAMNLVKDLITRVVSREKAGVFNISDMGSFFLTERTHDLIEYEKSIPKKMDLKFVGICAYHMDNFDMLTEDQQQKLVSFHHRVMGVRH